MEVDPSNAMNEPQPSAAASDAAAAAEDVDMAPAATGAKAKAKRKNKGKGRGKGKAKANANDQGKGEATGGATDEPKNNSTSNAADDAKVNPANETNDQANATASGKAKGAAQSPANAAAAVPNFKALSAKALAKSRSEIRKIPVPPHRLTPIRQNWMQIYEPIVKHLKLQIRMNLRTKCVEVKAGKNTEHVGALQKAADFVKAIVLGFSVADAIAIVRLDDLYVETFEVKDIRSTLKGDHLARAVGRIAGKDGRTKFTIENATKTRIVVADTRIHILGSYDNIRLARHSISSLVLGTAPGKVYNKLRTVSARLNERKF